MQLTNWLVAPKWIMGRASGAESPKVWMCAITSWRNFRSYSAAAAKSISSRCSAICWSCSSLIFKPSFFCALASASHSRRQVENFRCEPNRRRIDSLAYRPARGDR